MAISLSTCKRKNRHHITFLYDETQISIMTHTETNTFRPNRTNHPFIIGTTARSRSRVQFSLRRREILSSKRYDEKWCFGPNMKISNKLRNHLPRRYQFYMINCQIWVKPRYFNWRKKTFYFIYRLVRREKLF